MVIENVEINFKRYCLAKPKWITELYRYQSHASPLVIGAPDKRRLVRISTVSRTTQRRLKRKICRTSRYALRICGVIARNDLKLSDTELPTMFLEGDFGNLMCPPLPFRSKSGHGSPGVGADSGSSITSIPQTAPSTPHARVSPLR